MKSARLLAALGLAAVWTLIAATSDAAPASKLSVRVQGNRLVDGSGAVVRLRGVNYSGFEFVAVGGWSPADPSGAQAGQAGGPKWSAISDWKANAVRLPLNEASWLGYTCVDGDGASHNPDPGGNYQAAVAAQGQQANAAGLYVIVDLHWAAPGNTCPMLQTQMADADHAPAFWSSIANRFKNNPAVLFELYNEPYLYGLTAGADEWSVLRDGGTLSYYMAGTAAGGQKRIDTPWRTAGMQQMLDAIRATGASNVVLSCGTSWCNDLSGWLAHKPSDPLGQLAAAWHPYPPQQSVASATVVFGGLGYAVGDTITLPKPNTVYEAAVLKVTSVTLGGIITGLSVQSGGAYLQTTLPTLALLAAATSGGGTGATFLLSFSNLAANWSLPANWPRVQSIAAQLPVLLTEVGEHNAPGTSGAPFLAQLLPWADTNGLSYFGWAWDVWGNADNVLIKDVNGTASDGYGAYYRQHLLCVATGGVCL